MGPKPSIAASVRALWTRAPWWRVAVSLAGILTLLAILFPPWLPGPHKAGLKPKPAEPVAAYSPPPVPAQAPLAAREPMQPAAPAPADQKKHAKSTPPAPEADASPKAVSMNLAPPDAGLAKSQSAKTESQAGAETPIYMGKLFSGFFPAAGRKLPLPPGSWVVLADLRTGPQSSTYFLAKIENKRLVGAVTFFFDSFREGVQYRPAAECTDPANLYAAVESNQDSRDGGSQAYWTIRGIFATVWGRWADRGTRMDPVIRSAAGEMEVQQITLPQDLVQVKFLRVELWGRVLGNCYFSPELERISSKTVSNWMESEWSYLNYEKYPEKVAYIDRLKEWGQAWWPKFKGAAGPGAGEAAKAQAVLGPSLPTSSTAPSR